MLLSVILTRSGSSASLAVSSVDFRMLSATLMDMAFRMSDKKPMIATSLN